MDYEEYLDKKAIECFKETYGAEIEEALSQYKTKMAYNYFPPVLLNGSLDHDERHIIELVNENDQLLWRDVWDNAYELVEDLIKAIHEYGKKLDGYLEKDKEWNDDQKKQDT